MDSVDKKILAHYAKKDVKILKIEDQNGENDLGKALNFLLKGIRDSDLKLDQTKPLKIFALGVFGGRLDHTFSSLNLLLKYSLLYHKLIRQKKMNITFSDSYSFGTIFLPGKNLYHRSERFEQKDFCGIIPLPNRGLPANIHTTGLKWNITDSNPLCFGSFISSSNSFAHNQISVQTDEPLFFTSSLFHGSWNKMKHTLVSAINLGKNFILSRKMNHLL